LTFEKLLAVGVRQGGVRRTARRAVKLRRLFLAAILLPTLLLNARAQESASDAEKEAVKGVAETYLFAEETGERKGTFLGDAHIVFVDRDGERRTVALSKREGGERRGKTSRALQKIISVDIVNDGASVKVETVLSPEGPSELKHYQYLWLLKTKTGWKIAGIMMPGVQTQRPAVN
jgi:hypothetical protein